MTATVIPTSVTSSTMTTTNNTATATPPTTKSSTATTTAMRDQSQEIPIFLRKTYHMIDTCDPTIACWSEDGETFVVKDPVKFEKQVIPQFFKHSKFSSFVRQLNFYAFRKIKYADTIRIDPKLEAETANYWRFRHEKFQRGKPEWLAAIKRMNGQKQQQKKETKATPTVDALDASEQENSVLKSEVSNLKQRIEAMTKNIDQLTTMVEKVTLATSSEEVNNNNKRTKLEAPVTTPVPDMAVSASAPQPPLVTDSPAPAATDSAMELDDFALPPSIPSPLPVGDRTATASSELSDEGFVDQLFTAFKTGEFEFDEAENLPDASNAAEPENKDVNRPQPELMNRLGDALSILPRDIQEMIVDRLIQAITSPKEIQDSISAATALKQVGDKPAQPTSSVVVEPTPETNKVPKDPKQIANLQLAAATLAALLSQCGGDAKQVKDAHKTLLIPVHA